jgi:Uma2 family endonuclease
MTAEELAARPVPHQRTELVRGRLIVREPAAGRHGVVAARILVAIGIHLEAHPIGEVLAAETGFIVARDPDTVRAPDVAYVRRGRLPRHERTGFDALAPDLVVEVLSPGDRASDVQAKVADWIAAGTLLVWVVDPSQESACVVRADGTVAMLGACDVLHGEEVLPGFTLPLARVLAW